MSEKKEKAWKFILDGILLPAVAIPIMELLLLIPVPGPDRLFFLLYFAAFYLAAFLLTYLGHMGLIFRLLPVIPVAVLVISRDGVLFINCLGAFLVYLGAYFLLAAPGRKWILLGLLAGMLAVWIPREEIPNYLAGCLILLFAETVSEWMRGERRNWGLLLGMIAAIAFAIPSSEEPFRWEGLKRFISRTGEMLETAWNDVTYFFEGLSDGDQSGYVGYADVGGLAGGLSDSGSGREELYFRTVGKSMPVYLSGAAFSHLGPDGIGGRVEPDTPVNAWLALYLSALSRGEVTREEAVCFSRVDQAEIEYAYIRTSDLLIPSTVFKIDDPLRYGLEERESKGFTYDVNYLTFDTASPYFRRFAGDPRIAGEAVSFEEAERVAGEIYGFRLRDYLSPSEYAASVEKYAKIPEDPEYLDSSMATDRIRKLAEELAEGCGNDMEKAVRIEAFLRQYTYDISTDLRGAENYVDSFLFEEQKGYCVHFASAMVLLLRTEGIPARFVQGLHFIPDEDETVRSGSAHAWVEAFIKGLGWIRFEPTAAIESAEDVGWGLVITERPEEKDPNITPLLPEEEPEPPKPPAPVIRQEEEGENATVKGVFLTAGMYILVFLGVTAFLFLIYYVARRIRYRRLTPEEKLRENVALLRKKLDRRVPEGGRPESVFDYLPYMEDEEERGKLETLFRGYYRVRFRGDPASETFAEEMRQTARSYDSAGRLRRKKS